MQINSITNSVQKAIIYKNKNWIILDDINYDKQGNVYQYWSCVESIDISNKNPEWHDAVYIHNLRSLDIISAALSPFSRTYLYLDGELIK
jgi:hypothetical protein